MALYLTGDTHGNFRRLLPEAFYEQETMTKENIVLVCGDFGGVWYGDKRDNDGLDFLERRPFTTAFVPGNHENYDALRTYPLEEWRGGTVRPIRPSVLMLERGQVFELGGKRIFAMGGASSHDIRDGILEPDDPLFQKKFQRLNAQGALFRVNHRSWWKEELPSEEEYGEAKANLEKAGWAVDYIVTHCAPTSIQNALLREHSAPDALTDFLEEVSQRCRFKYHFFGHYHSNQVIQQKYVLLYEQILRLK
ncbi:metallophosphoesterase family protein [Flavonifractor plautii]|jgi:predicted phosphodiesterase|uniref:metallophosphoesterase family protein n=1 Tax=Flavonifractor plautii TaxID=292800 RepID=UPI000B39FD78|nr:metallophosphoesterase [Flavonifractor plautii]MCB5376344.1 metallophosphoesterase [Flavonifractor plautii]OUO80937.1 metallophosphatase [Flavonifractor plautii]